MSHTSTPDDKRRPVIAVCGSMSFIEEMEAVAQLLETKGLSALTPVREEHGRDWATLSRAEAVAMKREYVDIHLERIRGCDAVLVANLPKHGIQGYVGPNTLMEAAFAHAIGIPVVFLKDPFDQQNGLECASISAGCLEGNPGRILEFLRVH